MLVKKYSFKMNPYPFFEKLSMCIYLTYSFETTNHVIVQKNVFFPKQHISDSFGNYKILNNY